MRTKKTDGGFTLRGSFSVEAAMILPVIVGVMAAVIYMAFFVHDRAVLTQAAYTAAFRGGRQVKNGEEQMRKAADNACRDLTKGRLLAVRQVESSVAVGSGTVKVSLQGEWRIPGGVLADRLLSQNGFRVTVEQGAQGKDPVDFIRGIRKAKELGDRIREEGAE